MLRTEQELVLDDLTEMSKYAADQLEKMGAMTEDDILRDQFARCREMHLEHVRRLEAAIRRRGELPSAPDPDREAFDRLALRLRAALAPDRERIIAEEALRVEVRIEECLRKMPQMELDGDLRSLLTVLGDNCAEMRRRLGQFLQQT